MLKTEAVIFDWAGTTVDYGCFAPVRAFQEVFRHYGIEPEIEEVREPMGMLKIDHIRAMLKMNRIQGLWQEQYGEPWNEEDVHNMYGMFEKKLFGILDQYAAPKPGVLNTVDMLRRYNIKIGSTTGYTDKMMDIIVPKAKALGYAPDCWFSPDSAGGHGRPYPYMMFNNMKQLNVTDVRNVIKVGDTISDILEGKHAGVTTIGVIEGSSELGMTELEYEQYPGKEKLISQVRSRYLEAGADIVIRSIEELIEHISF